MNDHRDPFELLRLATRDIARDIDDGVDLSVDHDAARILERVLSAPPVRSLPAARRRKRRVLGGVVIGSLLTGTSVAAIAWFRDAPTEARTLSCWSDAHNPPAAQVGVQWDSTNPTDACAAVWAKGELSSKSAGVPALATCVLPNGVAAVIPGDESVCDQLGLSRFDGNISARSLAIRDVNNRLDEQVNESTCLGLDDALKAVNDALDDAGLDGWSVVEAALFTADEPCATVGLDADTSTAYVVPVPRAP